MKLYRQEYIGIILWGVPAGTVAKTPVRLFIDEPAEVFDEQFLSADQPFHRIGPSERPRARSVLYPEGAFRRVHAEPGHGKRKGCRQ